MDLGALARAGMTWWMESLIHFDPLDLSLRAVAAGRCRTGGTGAPISDSSGPLNQWPRGHRILALSSGPSVEVTVYRCSTSAGSPHVGQSMNVTRVSTAAPCKPVRRVRSVNGGRV